MDNYEIWEFDSHLFDQKKELPTSLSKNTVFQNPAQTKSAHWEHCFGVQIQRSLRCDGTYGSNVIHAFFKANGLAQANRLPTRLMVGENHDPGGCESMAGLEGAIYEGKWGCRMLD
jgi:hypothetical protein